MRITKLDLACAADKGLKGHPMAPLGQLVVLAGPNGAGKSRILGEVKSGLSTDLSQSAVSRAQAGITHVEATRIVFPQAEVLRWRHQVKMAQCLQVDESFQLGKVVEFFPKMPQLSDHRQQIEAQQQQAVKKLSENVGLENIATQASAYIASVYKRAFTATHPDVDVDIAAKDAASIQRDGLAVLVEDLLGTRPGFDLDQQPTLFGHPIPQANLSEGQSLLLQMAVALHAQEKSLDGLGGVLNYPERKICPGRRAVINNSCAPTRT